ncbi:protein mono-ADP-ribosyltransferase PARP14-like isoform X2 [Mytilus californianus]|uniref:protein mono-ADP-ribosyltransferase PARP14-like isoform X2 n=1 Tax=Mytilus californianus TaxID=6549 RepID=UPI0022470531|nr:protein mono-ADP-ribosyltransferase PARP14-like isoform X2 [Mytilus californianus]
MSNADLRKKICEKCILLKGFNTETNFNAIRQNFPESWRGTLATRTAGFEASDQEWIIQFDSIDVAQGYITVIGSLETSEGNLNISECELPCDIPDEWLQPPPYSEYPSQGPGTNQSASPLQQPGGPHGFPPFGPPFDPRFMTQHGPNPQNPYQQQFYPPGMGWPPYQPGHSEKGDPSQDQEKGPHGPGYPGQWGWPPYGGYYPYGQYGAYPGYGYPHGFIPQQEQQPGAKQNPNDKPEISIIEGERSDNPSASAEKSSTETPIQSDEEEEEKEDEEEEVKEEKEEDILEEKNDEPKKTTTNMLKVTKLPPTTTQDSLTYFFENTRKFGGGDVEDVEYDEDTASAIITFEEAEAVDIVLQKMPIMFNNKVIEVEAHNVNVEEPMDTTEEYESNLSTSEPAPTCTIEVRGMTDRTTQDTIMYYFESKKGANADVENIEYIEDKDMYLVTFEDEEAVDRTLQKNHTVDGSKLQVKKHIPPKRYQNKALVKGFNTKTTEDGIINFLEARTKFDVEGVDFGDEDSGKAIVTFCEPINIGDIQTACKKKALNGSYLTVHPVVVTNCIVVRGFSEKTTESGLEYYFDNKRKSGVEGVADVKMNRDEDYCVIYFENGEDALLACKRSHTIDNCKLKVQVFYDCLGVPADNEGPKFKPLPSLVITDIDKYKINFLKHSTTKRDAMEKELQEIYAQITWPSSTQESEITIDCALTKETKDCRKLAKSWGEEIRKNISGFVDALVTEKHSTLQDAWGPVMEKLREINISDPDGVTLSVEKPPVCEIIIAGYTLPVKEVSDKMKQIIDEVSADLDRKKQSIQEDTKLKHHQLLILVYTHFKDKVKQKFEKMDVKIDTKKLVISFNGLSGNISGAKIMMFETLNDITSASIGTKSQAYIQFLQRQEVKKYVGKKIKDKGLIGVWDIQGNTITMYSMSDADAVAASMILKDCVVETQVHVDNLQKSVMRSPKWAQYIQAIRDEYERKSIITEIIEDKQGQIILYCTSKGEAGMIREKIQDYFLDNSEKEITINLPPAQLKFLQEQMKDEVDDLEKGLRKQKIIVAVKGDGILIKGNPQGINDAEHEIEALVQKIYKTKHSMDKPGLQELMNSNQGKTKLKQVSKQAGVVISSDSDEGESSSGQIRPRQGASSDERAVYSAAGGQEVIVVKGDITGLHVDVIVNAANKDLAHSGGLAKVLVQRGGKSIQDECDQFTSYNGQLTEGECYCSKPGMLSCKMIVHAVGPVWQSGSNNEEDSLQQCVETALVDTQKNKHTSIAIPALCTGIFGYPPHLATRAIAQAVRDYFKRNKSSLVQTVYLCDVNENSVDLFVKAGDKMFDQAKDGKRKFGGRQSGGMSPGHSGPISAGSIEIKVVKGELAKMRVDAIVNTTSKGLQLNQGAVSASLLREGGRRLQDECSKKYPQGVDYGEVAVTTGGNLNCNIVCHGCLDQWNTGGIKVLEKFINGCLSKAEGKGCKSVAMPAMGTGKLGYPRGLVAKHMYDAVHQYSSQNPSSCITKVLFVLYDKDDQTVKAFEDEDKSRQGSHHGRHDRDFTDKPTGYQGRANSAKKGPDKKHQKLTPPGNQYSSAADKEYSVNMGNVVLKVYQGDITAVKVDAIVNGTNTELDLTIGAVARAIKNKGGQELEKQLKDQKKQMSKNGIAVTKHTHGMLCEAVIHLDMTGVNPSGYVSAAFSSGPKLKDRIKLALDKAEEIKMTTVAFPALGTSVTANVPVSDIAEDMFKVVEKFQSKSKHVQQVHVVIFQGDMMKDFMAAIQKCVSNTKEKGYIEKWFGWTGLTGGDKKFNISRHDRKLIGAQTPVDRVIMNSVTFVIYARDKHAAQNAVKLLEKSIESECDEKSIFSKIIKEFNADQKSEVKNLEASGKIKVTLDTSKGEIKIRGLKHHISDAFNEVHHIIRDAETAKQTMQKAKLVTDMVQWYYMEEDKGKKKLVEYPSDVNLILESALKDQKTQASFSDTNGNKYIVDLNAYEEYPADNVNDKVQVLRKSKLVDQAFEPPMTWVPMDEKENLKIVQLQPKDKEYQDVTSKFQSTAGGTKVEFVKVERIQNKVLYQQFIAKKKSMDDTNPKTVQNEKALWHGFSVDALDSICKYGFNRSYCGKNATALGAGVYFAVNVNYSIQDTYSRPDTHGHKRMFLCRVLTGEYCNGASTMKVPPAKPNAAGSHILYDTVTNNVSSPIMFVIFHDSQAFPEYLVTFKRK